MPLGRALTQEMRKTTSEEDREMGFYVSPSKIPYDEKTEWSNPNESESGEGSGEC